MGTLYGLQVWDENGRILLDTSDSLGRIIGVVSITSPGALSDSKLAQGRPFYIFQATAATGDVPTVSFSGVTLTWTVGAAMTPGLLFYGVF